MIIIDNGSEWMITIYLFQKSRGLTALVSLRLLIKKLVVFKTSSPKILTCTRTVRMVKGTLPKTR
jgi:hypothetical protein